MLIKTPISGEISLYFHLPFCTKKCDYCHFFILPNKKSYHKPLIDALLREIDLKRDLIHKKKIVSIYFGGGTPSLVSPSDFEKILSQLKKYCSITNSEITLELNPENHSKELLAQFHQVGINRLSIGAQSFNNHELKQLSRLHTSADTFTAIENANAVGFKNISIDLMYEILEQSFKSWKESLRVIEELPIQHLSLYNLSIEKHTVFYKYQKQVIDQLPEEKEALKMYLEAVKELQAFGFNQYEISAFCKENHYSRHNVGYWLQRNHIGFGPSAYSLLYQKRFQNVSHFAKYLKAINLGFIPIDSQEMLSTSSFRKESLALNLRLRQGLNLVEFQRRFGNLKETTQNKLSQIIEGKLATLKDNILKLTDRGILMHDAIAADLI